MKNTTFSYQYSAQRNREVEAIRLKYVPREISKIEVLKKLDAQVQTAGLLQGLVLGIIGCLIFGIGLCFGLDVLPGTPFLTVVFGVVGVGLMISAYPVYRRIARKTKARLTPEILRISEEIINS